MSDAEVSERLGSLEARFEERWNAHDNRSEDRLGAIENGIQRLVLKLEQLPCSDHVKEIRLNSLMRKVILWTVTIVVAAALSTFVGVKVKELLAAQSESFSTSGVSIITVEDAPNSNLY